MHVKRLSEESPDTKREIGESEVGGVESKKEEMVGGEEKAKRLRVGVGVKLLKERFRPP